MVTLCPRVNIPERLLSVKERADRLNIKMTKLCRKAECQISSVNRWLKGGHEIQMGNFLSACDRLEAVLTAEECRIFLALAPKFIPEHILAQIELPSGPSEGFGAVGSAAFAAGTRESEGAGAATPALQSLRSAGGAR